MQDEPAIITRPARTLCLASVPSHGYVELVDVLRMYSAVSGEFEHNRSLHRDKLVDHHAVSINQESAEMCGILPLRFVLPKVIQIADLEVPRLASHVTRELK